MIRPSILFFVAAGVALAQDDVSRQFSELRALVQKLQARVDELESRVPATPAAAVARPPAVTASAPAPAADPLRGTTVNLNVDGYYGYNFNQPIGRVNLLRAYDVSSNSFSLNQVGLVIENAPDVAKGRRFGARLDLQWGQATQAMQGNPVNEPRPEIYRALFQVYGTYVAPVARGLTIDFGKWACPMGLEGNYTKDQINYSRSFWFNFLPFYHMGMRMNLAINDRLGVNYWLVNGANQTEDFNGFKDQLFGFTAQPHKSVTWTFNYFLGQEHPDVRYFLNGAPPGLPTQQGVPFQPIADPPTGRLDIFDTYAAWHASPKLTFAGEFDWVRQRLFTSSPSDHTAGGAAYMRYQFTPRVAFAGRAEYLTDRGGLFSGVTQALKEATVTGEYKFAEGFLMRGEWRRDASNQPYFYSDTLGLLKKRQDTALVGLVWWFGAKDGAW